LCQLADAGELYSTCKLLAGRLGTVGWLRGVGRLGRLRRVGWLTERRRKGGKAEKGGMAEKRGKHG
jgi:hypothetical protein